MKNSDNWLAGVAVLYSAGYVYTYSQLRKPEPPKEGTWGYTLIRWFMGTAAWGGLAYAVKAGVEGAK